MNEINSQNYSVLDRDYILHWSTTWLVIYNSDKLDG